MGSLLSDREVAATAGLQAGHDARALEALLKACRDATSAQRLEWLERVKIETDRLTVTVIIPDTPPVRIEKTVPVSLRRRGHERRLVIAGGVAHADQADARTIRIIGDGLRFWEQLCSGKAATAKAIAQAEKLQERYVARSLQLAFLAPEVVALFVEGRQAPEWTAERLLRLKNLPRSWNDQRVLFGLG